jgi:uncharacterized protein
VSGLAVLLVAVACALVVAVGFALWVGSGLLLVPRGYELMPEFTVLDYEAGRVTLPPPPSAAQFADTRKRGVLGLLWRTGYGRLGPVVEDDGTRVVRPLEMVAGALPAAGEPARIDTFLYHRDPGQDLGLAFEDVRVESDVGELAGWWLPGSASTAVLVLHGRRRGERAETLRVLPALADGERSVLVLAYRNHRDSPPSPDGFYHYGATESDDALAGVAFLAARGAQRVVLYGFSMGGATALEASKRWPVEGPSLAGLILDSPLIDPAAVTEQRVRRTGMPFPRAWTRATLGLASWRSGLRWRTLDQRASADRIGVPMLLVAGVDDRTVPIDAVDAFAERVAGRLRYHRVAGADHIEAWNLDPSAYEGWVRGFLEGVERGGREA